MQGRVLRDLSKFLVNDDGYAVRVASNVATIAGYLGLFIAPWALWCGALTHRRDRWALLAALCLAAFMLGAGWLPPFREHQVMDAAGIGPQLLYDAFPGTPASLDRSAGILWRCAAVAAAYGMTVLVVVAARSVKAIARDTMEDRGERLYMAALLGIYLLPFVITDYFDRYLLFVLPFALALVARSWPEAAGVVRAAPTVRIAATAWIGLALILGAAATHDYFAWNRARWDAIRAAEQLGATPDNLDGGFEYNGYTRYEIKPRISREDKRWWWVADDRYVIAFSVPQGFVECAHFDVNRWLARTPPLVFLLERAGERPVCRPAP